MSVIIPIVAADGSQSTVTLPAPVVVGSSTAVQFPLLGQYLIGAGLPGTDPSWQAFAAKYDLMHVGFYAGLDGAPGPISAIKAINPNILMGNYTICTDNYGGSSAKAEANYLGTQVGPTGNGGSWTPNDWWARTSTGAKVGNYFNLTSFVTPNAQGQKCPQYAASWDNTNVLCDGADWDIWFCDDNYVRPRSGADWNRSGTTFAPGANNTSTSDAWWRSGVAAYYDAARAYFPTAIGHCRYIMANCDNDLGAGNYAGSAPQNYGTFPEYTNVLHGMLMEGAIGASWSCEENYGTSRLIKWYQGAVTKLLPPGLINFCQLIGPGPASGYIGSTTDYQSFRYGFGVCLVAGNGYYTPCDTTDYTTFFWFDEFDLAGTASPKWLGTAVDPPQTAAWSNGVWMRRFTNGLALMNPKGNGSQTVTPPAGYKHLTGTQAPTVNNGAAVTSTVTLADRDGLLLVKA
jgi:Hypothetical glycosyl hydrolase family 15